MLRAAVLGQTEYNFCVGLNWRLNGAEEQLIRESVPAVDGIKRDLLMPQLLYPGVLDKYKHTDIVLPRWIFNHASGERRPNASAGYFREYARDLAFELGLDADNPLYFRNAIWSLGKASVGSSVFREVQRLNRRARERYIATRENKY